MERRRLEKAAGGMAFFLNFLCFFLCFKTKKEEVTTGRILKKSQESVTATILVCEETKQGNNFLSMKGDLVDFLLNELRNRPAMYLGSYSLSKLPVLVAGFMAACISYDETKTGMIRFNSFFEWFEKRHSLERSSSWIEPFLEMANHDESIALDLFISELEIFVNKGNM